MKKFVISLMLVTMALSPVAYAQTVTTSAAMTEDQRAAAVLEIQSRILRLKAEASVLLLKRIAELKFQLVDLLKIRIEELRAELAVLIAKRNAEISAGIAR